MFYRNDSSGLGQIKCRLSDTENLPFSKLLSVAVVEEALMQAGMAYRDRIFSPMVTLWAFLSQVLSADGSCREAVARVLAWRVGQGLSACSSETTSYCDARKSLPLQVVQTLTRQTAVQLEQQAMAPWLWRGRHVKIVDGTTVTMPDTPANQEVFPQSSGQAEGVGFPIARLVVIFSLACGAALDAAIAPTRGKKTGETTLFRSMFDVFEPGDVLLGDRLFDNYRDISTLRERGIDVLLRMHQSRGCDFRRGRCLGKLDHVVVWKKPWFVAARIDRATYDALPDQMQMRELRFQIQVDGFRTDEIVLVTSMLDAVEYPLEELVELYRERWHCELDLNALKTTLQMDHLRCKSPKMVEKEIWMHLLAYNLMRQTMAEAACQHEQLPRRLSFKGAVQTVNSFAPWMAACPEQRERMWSHLLRAIASHQVGNRPDRNEPRKIKQRTAKYTYMTKPRTEERQRLYA